MMECTRITWTPELDEELRRRYVDQRESLESIATAWGTTKHALQTRASRKGIRVLPGLRHFGAKDTSIKLDCLACRKPFMSVDRCTNRV